MPRPNWFFAFPLRGDFVRALPEPPAGLRLYHPDDVHLTLAFLGGCGEPAAFRALGALDERLAAGSPAPIHVSLGSVAAMGSGPFSVLSALLERGRDETEALVVGLRDALTLAALGRILKRPPKPHVTLARLRRNATDARRKLALDWARSLDLRQVEATLDRIALYTWSHDRRERLFRVVTERTLRARAPSATD